MSIYHAVLMLGGNDIGPRGEFQLFFVTIMLLLAAIINANIFGNMAVLIQALNRKVANFQEKMEYASETMKNMKLPEHIQDDVKSYLTYTQTTLDHQKDLDTFLNMLSPSLRQEVSKHIFLDAIMQNQVFKDHSGLVNDLLHDMKTKLSLPEEKLIRQYDAGKSMFFIARGECDVFVLDESKTSRYTQTLTSGNYFGEVALIKYCRRTATVVSKNYSTLSELDIEAYKVLVQRYPFIRE